MQAIAPEGIEQKSPEVFRATRPLHFLTAQNIAWLKEKALASSKKRARICLHKEGDNPVHEMVIAVHKSSFVPPHMHPYKEESFHVIEGACDVFVCNEEGKVTEIVPLRAFPDKDGSYFYRIGPNIIHGFRMISDFLVFHEVAAGPAKEGANFTPAWVPEFKDDAEGLAWVEKLLSQKK